MRSDAKDITGMTFGRLTALRIDETNTRHWIFRCSCGKEVSRIKGSVASSQNTRSCGCLLLSPDLDKLRESRKEKWAFLSDIIDLSSFTERQRTIIALLIEGKTQKEIGILLSVNQGSINKSIIGQKGYGGILRKIEKMKKEAKEQKEKEDAILQMGLSLPPYATFEEVKKARDMGRLLNRMLNKRIKKEQEREPRHEELIIELIHLRDVRREAVKDMSALMRDKQKETK